MTDTLPTTETAAEIEELFAEFVEAVEQDPAFDPRALLVRARGRRQELQARIALYRSLGGLRESLTQVDETPTPARLGRFEIRGPLGLGGLSSVYLAEDPRLGLTVALKVLTPHGLQVAAARQWLLNEGRSLARLEHPSVVKVIEVGEEHGHAWIAMELIRGPSLEHVIAALQGGGDAEPGNRPANPTWTSSLSTARSRGWICNGERLERGSGSSSGRHTG